jgi:hypothetical protein
MPPSARSCNRAAFSPFVNRVSSTLRAGMAVRLGGFRLLSFLSPALLHHLRQSLSGGCAHSTAPLPSRSTVSSRALSGGAGRVNSLERSNGLVDAVSFLF